jgi:hypothetical protein
MRRAIRDARLQLGFGKPQSVAPPPFDMSLDETTHVDNGAPAFDGSRTVPTIMEAHLPPPAPVPQVSHGPDGTFIGMGGEGGRMTSVVGNDGSLPVAPAVSAAAPFAATAFAPQPNPPRKSSRPPPLPNGPMRPPLLTGPPTPGIAFNGSQPVQAPYVIRRPGSRPDGTEGSIPAYGGTVKVGAEDSVSDIDPSSLEARRKSTVAIWLVAVFLAAAALGGIAFFAVRKDPVPMPANDVPTAPPPTTPTPTPTTPTMPTTATPTTPTVTAPPTPPPGADLRPTTGTDAASPLRPTTPPWRPPPTPPTRPNRPTPPTSPTTPPPDTAKPVPTVPPDPFATPE